MFFVISGFLITGHILSDLKKDQFSFSLFYAKRVKRIFPAVAVMLFFNLLISMALFTRAEDLYNVSKSTVFGLFSISNFYSCFFVEHGYFSAETELDPLTHLWSLGVEEQFYFVLPIFLYVFYRFKMVNYIVLGVTFASFVFAEMIVSYYPMFAYYMLPARIGEMLLGSAITMLQMQTHLKKYEAQTGILGVLFIVVPMFVFDETSPFPGMRALFPTVGTVFVICSGHKTLASLLSFYPLRYVGLISYSMYLYHWPLMAFLRLMRVSFAGFNTIFILLGCFNFAYLSYVFVECQTRFLKLSNRQIYMYLFVVPFIILLCLSGFVGLYFFDLKSGNKEELEKKKMAAGGDNADLMNIPLFPYEKEIMLKKNDINRHMCFYPYLIKLDFSITNCKMGDYQGKPSKVLLWGDSHAFHYLGMLEEFAKAERAFFHHTTMAGCPPVNSNMLYHVNPLCFGFNDWAVTQARDMNVVVLAARWSLHKLTKKQALEVIEKIRKVNKDAYIIFLGEIPFYKEFSLKSCPEIRTEEMNCDSHSLITSYKKGEYTLSFNDDMKIAALEQPRVG